MKQVGRKSGWNTRFRFRDVFLDQSFYSRSFRERDGNEVVDEILFFIYICNA